MTTYNKTNLKTFFEQADIPSGTDYANLIDSQVNIAETSEQSMASNLKVPKLITPLVSATTGDYTTLNATTLNVTTVSSTKVVTTDVSASGTVYTSATRSQIGNIGNVTIVSATGTARATAAPMPISYMVRGQGVTDGSATGFLLPTPIAGLSTYFIYEGAVSANLWPVGADYTINALASGAVFALTANTSYTILFTTASAYRVK